MGTFRTNCTIEKFLSRGKSAVVPDTLVDTGSEFTWVPAHVLQGIGIQRVKKDVPFLMANGQQVTRSIGFAIVRVGAAFTVDEVVFGEPGDMNLLGARSLEGLNLAVDPARKRLVAAGPLPAAKLAATPRRPTKATRKKKHK
jgi:predicted aspartyl protease